MRVAPYSRRLSRRFRRAATALGTTAAVCVTMGLLPSALTGQLSAGEIRDGRVLVLSGATVVDGTGSEPLPDANVVVEGDRISCVGSAEECPPPSGARELELDGHWITPGLVDAHVHFSQSGWVDGRPDARDLRHEHPYPETVLELRQNPERFFRAYLCSGVTAVFDVGGYPWTWGLRGHAEPGQPVPRIAAAGPLLSTRDHWVNLPAELQFVHIPDEEGVRAGIEYLVSRDTDAIKVWYLVQPGTAEEATYRPLLELAGALAQEAGVPLIVHATALEAAKQAIRSGAHLLVHSVTDQIVDDEFLEMARDAGTMYNPTLTVYEGYHDIQAGFFREGRYPLDCVDPGTLQRARATEEWRDTVDPEEVALSARELEQRNRLLAENLRRVHQAEIPIAAGTDAGNPLTLHGPSIHRELSMMRQAGLTPMEVLVSATLNGARAMGRAEDFGSIEAGKLADLLVVGSDPTVDLNAFEDLSFLLLGGEIHRPEALLPDPPR